MCNAFSTLLIITSYDATNAFFGKNVKKVFKKVPFTHVFKTFRSIGQSARLNSSMFLTCDDVFLLNLAFFILLYSIQVYFYIFRLDTKFPIFGLNDWMCHYVETFVGQCNFMNEVKKFLKLFHQEKSK